MLVDHNSIVQNLKKHGYTNTIIQYPEFLKIYNPYKEMMNELEFATILGISQANYRNLKYRGSKVKILPEERAVSEKKKKEIWEELYAAGYANKMINYVEFLELHQTYAEEVDEKDFAKILEISHHSYSKLKTGKHKVNIIKSDREIGEKEKEEIRKNIREKGYEGTYITYTQFLALYKPYERSMSEKQFAELLHISIPNYRSIKNQGKKAKIVTINNNTIDERRKENIIQTLKQQGYEEKEIGYTQFLEIYAPYKSKMTEMELATILGISYDMYTHLKYKQNYTVPILPKQRKVTSDRKDAIRREIEEKGYANRAVSYLELLALYQPYQDELEEINFLEIVRISPENYKTMRDKGTKGWILKNKKIVTEERRRQIQETLLAQYGGNTRRIGYAEFLEIYAPYKQEIQEVTFAQLLGIYEGSYKQMKHEGKTGNIQIKKDKINRVCYQLNRQNTVFKRKELESLCQEYGITVYDVLMQQFKSKQYVEKLLQEDQIYIGECEIPKAFREKYADILLQTAQKSARDVTYRYEIGSIQEDIASECLIYIMTNKGEIIKNSQNEEEAIVSLRKYMYIWMKYRCLDHFRERKHIFSLEDPFEKEENFTRYHVVKAQEDIEVEEEDVEPCDIIREMQKAYEQGKNKKDILQDIMQEYTIGKEELLDILQIELQNRRKIKQTANNKVYLGEER